MKPQDGRLRTGYIAGELSPEGRAAVYSVVSVICFSFGDFAILPRTRVFPEWVRLCDAHSLQRGGGEGAVDLRRSVAL